MGYDASVGGSVYLRPLTEEEKYELYKELAHRFGSFYATHDGWPNVSGPMDDISVAETETGIEIGVYGCDHYQEENFEDFYEILKSYIDFSRDNSFEFGGDDNLTWRLRFTENGVEYDSGSIVYDNEIPYAVCIRESCVRDAQYRTSYPEEESEDEEDDWENEDYWSDCSGPVFIKMIRAASREEAISKVAEEEGYDVSILEAYTC